MQEQASVWVGCVCGCTHTGTLEGATSPLHFRRSQQAVALWLKVFGYGIGNCALVPQSRSLSRPECSVARLPGIPRRTSCPAVRVIPSSSSQVMRSSHGTEERSCWGTFGLTCGRPAACSEHRAPVFTEHLLCAGPCRRQSSKHHFSLCMA